VAKKADSEEATEESVDLAVVKELGTIQADLDHLEELAAKAEELRDSVDAEVYERVESDYATRRSELNAKAAPLRIKAREERAALARAISAMRNDLQVATLRAEEIEFRHQVGELSEEDKKARLKAPQAEIKRRKRGLAKLEKTDAQFLEVLPQGDATEDAESEVTPAAAAKPTVVQNAEKPEQVVSPAQGADETILAPQSLDSDATVMAPEGFAQQLAASADAAAEAGEQNAADSTTVLQAARILVHEGKDTSEHYLGVLNYVGRGADCHIRLENPAVSRKHALISAAPDGFVVKDLGSPNGTLVNDAPVEEQMLHDGDKLQLGEVELEFRSP